MTLITSVFRLGATPVGRKGKERGGDEARANNKFYGGLVVRMKGHGGEWGIGRGEEGGGECGALIHRAGDGIRVKVCLI